MNDRLATHVEAADQPRSGASAFHRHGLHAVAVALLALLALPMWSHCSGRQGPTAIGASNAAKAVVMFVGEPGSADVIIDGEYVTTVQLAKGGVALPPGFHTVELRAETYMSHYVELTLTAGSTVSVPFRLLAELP